MITVNALGEDRDKEASKAVRISLRMGKVYRLVRKRNIIAVIAEIYLSRDLKSWPASSSSNLLGVLARSLSGPGTLNRRQRSTSNFTHLVAASAHASNFRLPGL